jgi:hypothetical protein
MGKYELYGDDHEVTETVISVDGSPRDQQLAVSKVWKRAGDGKEQAPADEPKRRATAQPKPPAKEG